MLFKLSLLLSTIGIIACNVPFDTTKEVKYEEINQIYQRNYQHSEYLNSLTEVVYKYESNEVDSVDDLVVGNIYLLDLSNYEFSTAVNVVRATMTRGSRFSNEVVEVANQDNAGAYLRVRLASDGVTIQNFDQYNSGGSVAYCDYGYVIFQYYSDFNASFIDLVSYTSYNEIESVIYHQPQTVVGVINEFCETYLFSEIPYINSMTFEVGGQSINLMTYLIIIVGICVAIGLLILFFFLMKWLVCFFGGLFKIRR